MCGYNTSGELAKEGGVGEVSSGEVSSGEVSSGEVSKIKDRRSKVSRKEHMRIRGRDKELGPHSAYKDVTRIRDGWDSPHLSNLVWQVPRTKKLGKQMPYAYTVGENIQTKEGGKI